MENKLTKEQLTEAIDTAQNIIILSHRNPDGDALGSSLALKYILEKSAKTATVLVPSAYPSNLEWMHGVAATIVYDQQPDLAVETIKSSDLVFILDFNALSRIDKMGESVAQLSVPKVMIDHHINPEDCADFYWSDTEASSTCELLVEFVRFIGWGHKIDKVFAETVYVGLLTDTGTFSYAVRPQTFLLVADLLGYGVDHTGIQNLLFNSMDEKVLRLLGYCLIERMEIIPEYRTAIFTLSKEDYEKFDIQRGDTEGIVNYGLKMKDVQMAIMIMEQPGIVKLSFRSKGDLSVEAFARENFKGGGHFNAAGGQSFQTLSGTVTRVKKLLPGYVPKVE